MVWEGVANVTITLEEDAEDIGYDSPGRDVKNYKIVAFPFQRGSVNDLFDELGKYDDRKWRMLQYASGKYEDIENNGIVDPGKGYFFISLEKVDLMVGGSSPEFPLGRLNKALEDGFTLIGNPFFETLNWDEVIRFNVDQGTIEANEIRGLITYDNGKWGVANTLAKYEGAFVEANRVINLAIPYAAVSSSRMAEREAEPSVQSVTDEEWSINLFLKSNELKYHVGRFGIRKGALDSNDKYDMGMVPQLEDHVAIEFDGGRAWDYKPGGGYKSWEFSIPNNLKDDEFEMRWDSPETGDQLLMMYDATRHKLIDLRNYTVYRIKNDPKAMHQFLFGTREEIEKNFQSSNAVVFDLFPNPVSERLHLSLYVPNDQSTELVIRNLEGKTMFKEPIYLNKGTNTIDLNVKEIPEGFYLLQVPTESNQEFFIADVRNENNKITIDFRIDGDLPLERYEVMLYSSHDSYSQPMQFVTGDVEEELPNNDQVYTLIWDAQRELIEFEGEIQLELRGEVSYKPIHSAQEKLSGKQLKETEIQWQGGNPADRVKIELVKNGEVIKEIATSNNTGEYQWLIAKDVEKGKGYRIRLTNVSDAEEVHESPAFAIGGGVNPIIIAGGSAGAAGIDLGRLLILTILAM
ncbi:unnamed protein product [Symbiodinium microadriaticum]|nr:unnamed protein product [Symbiodinium microadriaticum]